MKEKKMEVNAYESNGIVALEVKGRVDSGTSKEFEDAIIPIIDSGTTKIILEFSGLDYISSAGLRVLLIASKKLAGIHGKIVIVGMNEDIHDIFDISGLLPYFKSFDSVQDAVEFLNSL